MNGQGTERFQFKLKSSVSGGVEDSSLPASAEQLLKLGQFELQMRKGVVAPTAHAPLQPAVEPPKSLQVPASKKFWQAGGLTVDSGTVHRLPGQLSVE